MSDDYKDDFEEIQPLNSTVGNHIQYKLVTKISFDNFDPFSNIRRFSSPLSLKICKKYNILEQQLFHKSYNEIKAGMSIIDQRDTELVKMKYFEIENQRIKLVEELRKIRENVINGKIDFFDQNEIYCDIVFFINL